MLPKILTPNRAFPVLWVWLLTSVFFYCTAHLQNSSGLYSPNFDLRRQTDALLEGKLRLSDSPVLHNVDWVWGEDGVYQPWNLGVPILRLPLDFIAKLFNYPGFPDRLFFFIFFGLCLLYFLESLNICSNKAGAKTIQDYYFVFLLALAPCWLQLVGVRFYVYEEVISYSILWQFLLFGSLLRFFHAQTTKNLIVLSLLCAFAPIIRPTGLITALVTFLLAQYKLLTTSKNYAKALMALALFCVGPIFCLYTNLIRFGSPLEFSHHLSLSFNPTIDLLVRFPSPYGSIGSSESILELFGSLFLVDDFSNRDYFSPAIHILQSSVPRMREFYFRTFGAEWFILGILGTIISLVLLPKLKALDHNNYKADPFTSIVPLWAYANFFLFAAFYHNTPAISSRYIMEFFPSLLVIIIWSMHMMFLASSVLMSASFKQSFPVLVALLTLSCIFIPGLGEATNPHTNDFNRSIDSTQLRQLQNISSNYRQNRQAVSLPLPESYQCNSDLEVYGIGANGQDWQTDCSVFHTTVLFFKQALCYKVSLQDVRTSKRSSFLDFVKNEVRVKENLENLVVRSTSQKDETLDLEFCHPRGIQDLDSPPIRMLSLGWVSSETLVKEGIPTRPSLKLLSVERVNG